MQLSHITKAPYWTIADSDAAWKEGWDIFDCDGSENGRWQICRIDDPEDWQECHKLSFRPPTLSNDDDAWAIVINGEEDHHQRALFFIQAHNKIEWKCLVEHAERFHNIRLED